MQKKHLKRFALLLTAALALLCLAACGNDQAQPTPTDSPAPVHTTEPTPVPTAAPAPATDWTAFTGWVEEGWDAKDISYQFTGTWSMDGEYAMKYDVLINLYDDGSAMAVQYGSMTYTYYGYWSEADTEDGTEITFDTVSEAPLEEGGDMVAHEYNYVLYEESDGGFSFGYTINLAPGQYFRTADVAGSSTVAYDTVADFTAAVDAANTAA